MQYRIIHGVLAGIRAGCETYMVLDKVSPTKEILEKQVPIYNDLTEVLADLTDVLLFKSKRNKTG